MGKKCKQIPIMSSIIRVCPVTSVIITERGNWSFFDRVKWLSFLLVKLGLQSSFWVLILTALIPLGWFLICNAMYQSLQSETWTWTDPFTSQGTVSHVIGTRPSWSSAMLLKDLVLKSRSPRLHPGHLSTIFTMTVLPFRRKKWWNKNEKYFL